MKSLLSFQNRSSTLFLQHKPHNPRVTNYFVRLKCVVCLTSVQIVSISERAGNRSVSAKRQLSHADDINARA